MKKFLVKNINGVFPEKSNSFKINKEGNPDQVVQTTRECLEVGARGGGYVFSVADCMAPGTPKASTKIRFIIRKIDKVKLS